MKRHVWILTSRMLVMLTGSAFCSQPLLFAGAPPDQQAYVVTVRPDASVDGIRFIAEQMAASYGGTVAKEAGAPQDAFVLHISAERARVLAKDPRVVSLTYYRAGSTPSRRESLRRNVAPRFGISSSAAGWFAALTLKRSRIVSEIS